MSIMRAAALFCGSFVIACGGFASTAAAQHSHHHHDHDQGGSGWDFGSGWTGVSGTDAAGHLVDAAGHHVTPNGHHTNGAYYPGGLFDGWTGVAGTDAQGHLVDAAGHHVTPNGYHTNGAYYGDDSYYQNNYQSNYSTNGYYQPQAYPAQSGYYQQTAATLPQNSLPQNFFPGATVPAGPMARIEITGPDAGSVRYRLNGTAYSISAGQSQQFRADRRWIIEFDRGTGSAARYTLTGGNVYQFSAAAQGWDLQVSADSSTGQAPPPAVSFNR